MEKNEEEFLKIIKKISEEIMKYYNTYNRFGVKLPAPDYGDSPEWFKDDMFSTTSVFINEEYQGFLDMNMFLYSIFFTLVTFILGLLVFNKMEKNFIDTV